MAESLLVAEGMTKAIKNQVLVEPIDVRLDKGQVLALCGGNGAGKSTILRMLAGILRPSGGSVRLNGWEWASNRAEYAKQLGYMPDDYSFSPGLTAGEALNFWAALRGISKLRVQEVLETVGLEHKRSGRVQTFSKGMRQRLLFAQAILAEPPLLLMDEPTNGLDPYWMDEFVRLLDGLKQKGHAVVFSTHQLQVAEDIADRVVFLIEGRKCAEGDVESYRAIHGEHPLHAAFKAALE